MRKPKCSLKILQNARGQFASHWEQKDLKKKRIKKGETKKKLTRIRLIF